MWRREGNNVRNVPRRRIMAEKKVCVLATACGPRQLASGIGRWDKLGDQSAARVGATRLGKQGWFQLAEGWLYARRGH